MKILFFLLFLLACAGVFWSLDQIIRRMAYRKSQRYLHCRTVPAVFLTLLMAANVYTISYPLDLLNRIINSPLLAYFFSLVLPNRSYQLVYMLLVLLGLNLAAMLLVISCLGVLRLAFLRSTGFLDLTDAPLKDKLLHLPWLAAHFFYDGNNGSIRLNGRGFTMGIWVKGFKRTFAILWALQILVLGGSILWGSESWNTFLLSVTKSWYLLPMVGYLILEQVQFFLEGIFDDDAGTFGSAFIQERQDNSMLPLWTAYQQVFSRTNALLCCDMGGSLIPEQDGLGSNDLGNQLLKDCTQSDVLDVLSNQLQQCGVRQSDQYQNALAELLNGSCINVCDLCEGEFLIYLCAYLNYQMSQGRSVLLLCKDSRRAAELCEAVNREMHRLNNLYSIWDVRTLEGAEVNSRMSMLICSIDEFLNHHIAEKRQDFIGDLFCTVLADSLELFSGDSICLDRLFGILRGVESLQQYVAFSGVNNDALRTAMEQAFKREVIPFTNDCVHLPNSGVMVWRGESSCHLQCQLGIGTSMSPYMGTALPLALVAIRYDFPRVNLIPDNAHADRAFFDVLTMSSQEVTNYLSKSVNLRSMIRSHPAEALEEQDLSVTVVYDTDCNFFNALNRWKKYGGRLGSLLHIISPPYALREYFAANYTDRRLHLRNNEFDALISSRMGTCVSHMAALLISLCDNGMTDVELMEKVKEYHWSYESVDQLLTDCLKVVLTQEEIHSIYECFHFEEEKRFRDDLGVFETHTRITLIDSTILDRLHERVGYAVLVSKDDQRQNLPILCGNIHNHFLREQIISVGGYLYQIHSISGGTIYAEQRMTYNLPEYHQLSSFAFGKLQPRESGMDSGPVRLKLYTGNVARTIPGYWSCSGGNTFAAPGVHLSRLSEPLTTCMDGVSILEVRIQRSALGEHSEEAARLLAYLLKDFARTLFPKTHQNLFTVMPDGDCDLLDRVLEKGREASLEDIVCSLVPQVTGAPESQEDFISIFCVEYSCVEFGMVQMLYSRFRSILLILREYLGWYLDSNGTPAADQAVTQAQSDTECRADSAPVSRIRGTYLHFGADVIPSSIDPAGLLTLCRSLMLEESCDEITAPVDVKLDIDIPRCTFCGRHTMYPVTLSDGRKMCGHCRDHQLTQQEEIRSMYRDTLRYLKDGYGISLPSNLHIRFQSADAIRRAAGGSEDGRILGFYNSSSHMLWLEARGPRIAMQSTLIHELTHAWQYHEAEFIQRLQRVLRKFPRRERNRIRLQLLEGHAVYMEIETMRRMHEDSFADRMHAISMTRQDEYGAGYRMLRDYINDQAQLGSYMTPFKAMIQLLQDILDGKAAIQ